MESLKDSNRNLKTELIAAKGFSGLPAEWDGRQLADLTARRAPRDEEDAYADSADIAHADADAHAGLDLDAASSSLELIPVAASRQRRNNISGYGPGPGVAIGGERVHGPGSVAITVAASTRPPAALSRRSKPTAKSPFLAAALSAFRQFFYTDNGARGPQQFRFCYILILVGAIITAVTLAVGFVAQDGWTIAAVNVAVGALLLILLTRGHYAHCRCWDFG
ncbi:MAG: hypothetical protein M1838_000137 [Thelocarpon superellum]|nr:MAG: hypothetical protein M1838_000137 [Thelocarpon superellum]